MAIDRFSSRHNVREDLIDPVTPSPLVQKEVRNPAGQWKPANWLPIAFSKNNATMGTDYFVCSAGKAVAFTADGFMLPAGLRIRWAGLAATGTTALTYTTDDVNQGVYDITTGAKLTGAKTVTKKELADAILGRGLLARSDDGGVTVALDTNECATVINAYISKPVGFALSDWYVWAGSQWNSDPHFTNNSKQHLVSFWTEGQLKLPHRVATQTTTAAYNETTLVTETWAVGKVVESGEMWDVTNVRQIPRYSALGAAAPVVALGLEEAPVARVTDRTPFTGGGDAAAAASLLVTQKSAVTDVTAAGDWYLDAEQGVLFVHQPTWAATNTTTLTFTYYHYESATAATTHQYVHFDGPVKAGDLVGIDADSNYIRIAEGTTTAVDVVGRVLEVQVKPDPLMPQVKTAWSATGFGASSQMPGSASKGFPSEIMLSPEVVADQIVIVNVRI